jgi:hypothetical protein
MSHDFRRVSTRKNIDGIQHWPEIYPHVEEFLDAAWLMETTERKLFQVALVIRYMGHVSSHIQDKPKTQYFKFKLTTFTKEGMLLEIGHILDGMKLALDYQPFSKNRSMTVGMHVSLLYYDEDSILALGTGPTDVVIPFADDTVFTGGGS